MSGYSNSSYSIAGQMAQNEEYDRRNWFLKRDSDGGVVLSGPEAYVKERYRLNAEEFDRQFLYLEDPDGEQFGWNKKTRKWDKI